MLTYSFEDRGEESLYGHLYRCIRRDIESGAIPAYAKLPSKRAFAQHLGVSLITVEGAYTQLVAEGYVRSVPRTGYFANPLALPQAMRRGSRRWNAGRRRGSGSASARGGSRRCDGREGGRLGLDGGNGRGGTCGEGRCGGRRRGASGQRLGAGWRTPR